MFLQVFKGRVELILEQQMSIQAPSKGRREDRSIVSNFHQNAEK